MALTARPAAAPAKPAPPPPLTLAQQRNALFGGFRGQPPALEMEQMLQPLILPTNPQPGSVITFQLRNVGLIRGLWLAIRGTITASASSAQTLSRIGIPNIVSTVDFQDYSTYHRITTTGWHLHAIQSRKSGAPWQAAFQTDTASGYANNNPATLNRNSISGIQAKSSLAASASTDFQMLYRIPFARDRFDLRGALWAKVTSAAAFVFVTLNPNMFVNSTADPTQCVYQSADGTLCTLSNVQIECYQDYLDAIPMYAGREALPLADLQEAYLLSNTVSGVLQPNNENTFAFTDQRQFLSATAIYDNAGTLNFGTDVYRWSLFAANLTPIFQRTAARQFVVQRDLFKDDLPPGMYFFDFMHRPIDTTAYGNVQLSLNPSTVVGSTSSVLLGYEMFGRIGQIVKAQAIPSGGGL